MVVHAGIIGPLQVYTGPFIRPGLLPLQKNQAWPVFSWARPCRQGEDRSGPVWPGPSSSYFKYYFTSGV